MVSFTVSLASLGTDLNKYFMRGDASKKQKYQPLRSHESTDLIKKQTNSMQINKIVS